MIDKVLDEREVDYILKRVMIKRGVFGHESEIVGVVTDVCSHIRSNYPMNDEDYLDMFDKILLYVMSNSPSEKVSLENKFTRSDLEDYVTNTKLKVKRFFGGVSGKDVVGEVVV